MDSCLDGNAQVSTIVKAYNYHLSPIACFRRYITTEACKLAVLALVIWRLDYYSGLLNAANRTPGQQTAEHPESGCETGGEAAGATRSVVACQPELAAAPLAALCDSGWHTSCACMFATPSLTLGLPICESCSLSMPWTSGCVERPISSWFLAVQRGEWEELALVWLAPRSGTLFQKP